MSNIATRHATHEEWRKLAQKMTSPERREDFLAGRIPCFDDREGTRRVLPPLTRAIDETVLVTRAAPPKASPIVAPTPSAPPKATAVDTSALWSELERGAMTPEERDAASRLDAAFAALPASRPETREKRIATDTSDLLDELHRDLDLAEPREPEARREAGDVSDLAAELLGGDA